MIEKPTPEQNQQIDRLVKTLQVYLTIAGVDAPTGVCALTEVILLMYTKVAELSDIDQTRKSFNDFIQIISKSGNDLIDRVEKIKKDRESLKAKEPLVNDLDSVVSLFKGTRAKPNG